MKVGATSHAWVQDPLHLRVHICGRKQATCHSTREHIEGVS